MASEEHITSLFNRLKEIQQNAEQFGHFSIDSIDEINQLKSQFKKIKHLAGIQYCNKVISTIYELIADLSFDNREKEKLYQLALKAINGSYLEGAKYTNPTLPKRIGRIKSKLADLYHSVNQHQKAADLARDANVIFYATVKQFPNYLEGFLEQKQHWFRNMKWSIERELFDLSRLKNKFSKDNRPNNSKTSSNEKLKHISEIEILIEGCKNLKSIYNLQQQEGGNLKKVGRMISLNNY